MALVLFDLNLVCRIAAPFCLPQNLSRHRHSHRNTCVGCLPEGERRRCPMSAFVSAHASLFAIASFGLADVRAGSQP
jgi:hypothetical protein